MKNYALKRLLQLIPILLAITFLSYGMMRIAGSDVIEQKMENTSGTVSQEMIDNARAELGLDKPFVVQYFTWLGNLLKGDMGTSYVSNKPVFSTFVSKLPATLLLTAVSILLTVLISIPLGIWSAVKQNKVTDYVIRTASFIGNSLPNFFVSLLLMYFFAIRLGWFPVISGGVSLQSVALPALTLAIAMSAKYLRQVRATVLDELSKDYVLGARARGVKFSTTLIKSVMKASLVIIDEIGYTSITREQANKFFVLISELYEQSSVVFTTNKDIAEWAELFGDPVLTQALLDRILHHARCFSLDGDSYRLKHPELFVGIEGDGSL